MQPIQPIEEDSHGHPRFKENKIVTYLLETGGLDLNDLASARIEFPEEDWEQFAQLIGYSLHGFGTLSYVTDETYNAANKMYLEGLSEDDARIESLQNTLNDIKSGLRTAAVAAFGSHPDDLK